MLPWLFCAAVASADPDGRRVLESIDVVERAGATEIRIGFTMRVRYLRHAPQSHGNELQIEVDPLPVSPDETASLARRESLGLGRSARVPVRDVSYQGASTAPRMLVVSFSRDVRFTVRPGDDFRSIVVVLEEPAAVRPPPPPAAPTPEPSPAPSMKPGASDGAAAKEPAGPGHLVQLYAGAVDAPLPELPPSPALQGATLHTALVEKDGVTLRRVSVGTFPDRASAERAREELLARFPDAFVLAAPSEAAGRTSEPARDRAPAAETPPALPPRARPVVAWSPVPGPASAETLAQIDRTMTDARAALTSGDLDAAIRALTKVVTLPESPATREAKELLGVARERRGQLAHARAEYEEYLSHWSDGEDAARVRQRLDALLTARAAKPEPRRRESAERSPGPDLQLHGSVSTQYRNESYRTDLSGSEKVDDSLYSDAVFLFRARTEGWNVRGQTAGSYLFDFLPGSPRNETRVSAMFLDLAQREGPWGGIAGRQPGNTAGVNSRFDGLRVSNRFHERWKLTAVGGMPIELRDSARIETGRFLYGISLDGERLFEHLDAQVFLIQQHADGMLDRTAIGGELRWADETRFGAAYLDYDLLFQTLNTLLLTGTWQIGTATSLNALVDYRNSPLMESWSAIQGQDADRLGDLRDDFSDRELRELARDRTARSITLSLGGSHQLREWLQLALDVSASNLSSTSGSGGVEGTDSSGWEIAYFPQLVGSSLLTSGDVTTLGYRYFAGKTTTTHSLMLNERFPITRSLRLMPRFRVDWRDRAGSDVFAPTPQQLQDDPFAVAQATRVRRGTTTLHGFFGGEYRIGPVTLDAEGGWEWTTGAAKEDGGDEVGWSVTAGVRYDF